MWNIAFGAALGLGAEMDLIRSRDQAPTTTRLSPLPITNSARILAAEVEQIKPLAQAERRDRFPPPFGRESERLPP
jgi:hypothetical protein